MWEIEISKVPTLEDPKIQAEIGLREQLINAACQESSLAREFWHQFSESGGTIFDLGALAAMALGGQSLF